MNTKLHAISASLCLVLAACGGGGGSSSGSTASGVDVQSQRSGTSTASSTNLTIDQINTYAGDAAYTTINQNRTTCGFSSLARDERLNQVAVSHASYLAKNSDFLLANNVYGHGEPYKDLPYFTGENVKARAEAKGYSINYSLGAQINDTLVSFDNVSPTPSLGSEAAYKLMSAPYHMVAIFDAFTNVGTGQRHSSNVGVNANKTVVNVVVARQASIPGETGTSTDVKTFPCQGTAGVPTQLLNEIPNPVPGRNLATNPIGQPIFIRSASGSALKVVDIAVKDDKGQAVALLPTLDSTSDSNKMLYKNEAFAMPAGPLSAYTTYSVSANVTVNGAAKNISFTFATGAKNTI